MIGKSSAQLPLDMACAAPSRVRNFCPQESGPIHEKIALSENLGKPGQSRSVWSAGAAVVIAVAGSTAARVPAELAPSGLTILATSAQTAAAALEASLDAAARAPPAARLPSNRLALRATQSSCDGSRPGPDAGSSHQRSLAGRERGGSREATRHVPRWPLRLHLQLLIRKLPDHYFEESFKPIQPI
ncbi:hypothetical protein PR003_g25777 [Phytophthora rubi]|uniref:Uncharacterized protein n=1 Tax=Phytophthora rubi TaxID=129364 RepID=A0A6A3ID40_9STRA|nr:hypothetical protein PR002_g24843 [Phytophthora rubi]KAE8979626.1 hypothetical protein PR001_g24497 [Phytophthora rubi]KAE9288535.1 hypothetical protein PR003_g25777 [Phytophthora rubi]